MAGIDLERIECCRAYALAQMELDMVHNRQQYAERCRNFVFKRKTSQTPPRLIASWVLELKIAWVD